MSRLNNKNGILNHNEEAHAPIPVLHIIKSLGRGGAETLLPETLNNHDKTKFTFHYIYFLPWKNQMAAEIEKAGGKVMCLASKNNIEIILKVRRIAKYIKQHKIQLIHCHLPWAGIVGRLAGKLSKVPVVYTEHNTWDHYHKLTYYFNKLSFSSQEKVIAVSNDVAESIGKHYGKSHPQIEIVMNGINTEKFSNSLPATIDIRGQLNIKPDAIVIGIVCVFRAQKRLHVWLEIAANLIKKYSNCYFIIVGDGILKEEIKKKAGQLNLENHLHLAGLQSEIRPYLKAMDIFMMSSEFEGLPIALLEAMSMGCMPACTAAGGIPELITDGQNGLLVPVDRPLLLGNYLEKYIETPEEIKKLGHAARQTVINQFSMQKMVSELENIYETVIA